MRRAGGVEGGRGVLGDAVALRNRRLPDYADFGEGYASGPRELPGKLLVHGCYGLTGLVPLIVDCRHQHSYMPCGTQICPQLTTTTRDDESSVLSCDGDEISVTPDMAGAVDCEAMLVSRAGKQQAGEQLWYR